MMNKNRFIVGAAASLALVACDGRQEKMSDRTAVLEYEYESVCASYASWRAEAMESRHQAIREGRNPNTDFLYQNQNDAAGEFAGTMDSLERRYPGLNERGICERAMVRRLRDEGRL